jgi:hypothetical protein
MFASVAEGLSNNECLHIYSSKIQLAPDLRESMYCVRRGVSTVSYFRHNNTIHIIIIIIYKWHNKFGLR